MKQAAAEKEAAAGPATVTLDLLRDVAAPLLLAAGLSEPEKAVAEQVMRVLRDAGGTLEKLENRLKREQDTREKLVAERLKALQERYDDLARSFDSLKVESDKAVSEGARKVREAQASLGQLETDLKAVREHLADALKAAQATLLKLLQRPHRLMEIYGQDVYQAAKDTFASIGGDVAQLPHPEVNRQQEEEAAAEAAEAAEVAAND